MRAMEPEEACDKAQLVSVVVNFFNTASFLQAALDSVFTQTYGTWELLLVDDGSTDGSTEIARRAAAVDSTRISYLNHPGHENRGASAARNLGVAHARGEFVAFLDADDVWLPNRLERAVALFRENPAADMVYGRSEYWSSWAPTAEASDDYIQPQGFRADKLVRAPKLLLLYLTHGASVPVPTSVTVRRSAVRESGGWIDSFRGMYDDQAFLARICLRHNVFVSNECWDRYRQHADSLCARAAAQGEIDSARRAYLRWLRDFLEQQCSGDTRVLRALRYAERAQKYDRPGLCARLGRLLSRLAVRIRISLDEKAEAWRRPRP